MNTNVADRQERFTFPAEWEEHDCVWITWEREAYWSGESTDRLIIDIIQALQPFVKMRVVVKGAEEQETVSRLLRDRVTVREMNVEYVTMPENDRWLRDMGPIFLKGDQGSFRIADFGYNYYGERPRNHPHCVMVENVHREIARHLGLPLMNTNLVSEGGDREVNGKGTMICCEAVELQRNPEMPKQEVENELLRVMGQKKIIWVNQGPREDDKCTRGPIGDNIYTPTITGGHVDEFCRFVNERTILLAEVTEEERDKSPISAISYQRLEQTRAQLERETDQDGNPFSIERIPVTDHMLHNYTLPNDVNAYALDYFQGTTPGQTIQYNLSSSYLNFIVSNGVVVIPSYWKEGRPLSMQNKDEKAKSIMMRLFPDRKIVQINPEMINHGGGGMHCITQQQPKGVSPADGII